RRAHISQRRSSSPGHLWTKHDKRSKKNRWTPRSAVRRSRCVLAALTGEDRGELLLDDRGGEAVQFARGPVDLQRQALGHGRQADGGGTGVEVRGDLSALLAVVDGLGEVVQLGAGA